MKARHLLATGTPGEGVHVMQREGNANEDGFRQQRQQQQLLLLVLIMMTAATTSNSNFGEKDK